MLEVGLYGNIFSADYSVFGVLATDNTWFKNFWELSQLLDIDVTLHNKYHLSPVQEGDRSLMSDLFAVVTQIRSFNLSTWFGITSE